METIKAGCYLISKELKSIAIIYREKQNDFSFPKGHLEKGEDIKTCAIRETAEETKRDCVILDEYEPIIERYATFKGEKCVCYMYFALDTGKSKNDSTDTHELHWVKIDKVEETLTYPSQKNLWRTIKPTIENILL